MVLCHAGQQGSALHLCRCDQPSKHSVNNKGFWIARALCKSPVLYFVVVLVCGAQLASFGVQRGSISQQSGNVNLQPGLGILPTLFGMQQTPGILDMNRTCNPLTIRCFIAPDLPSENQTFSAYLF